MPVFTPLRLRRRKETPVVRRTSGIKQHHTNHVSAIALNCFEFEQKSQCAFDAECAQDSLLYRRKNRNYSMMASIEPKTAQLTIFYCGRVLVIDNLPADEAKDLMQLGSRGTSRIPAHSDLKKPPQTSASDLPIARKSSLHPFLEKRKDRINAKSPYQSTTGSPASPAPVNSQESKIMAFGWVSRCTSPDLA
ncbi:hypothetical protein OPV22_006018 [Ensete ventricosum]|uniref:Protein TIFY n=1 Tax=Ensete ventricosum TaxID=4639 RepID=A0AAV8QAL4_ENSVE|nr:hypothetical protein OPV22_006018 [Ensete ventricosum]